MFWILQLHRALDVRQLAGLGFQLAISNLELFEGAA